MNKYTPTIAVIGNGCAAAECIKAVRENSYRGTIHVFTDSKWPIYNPMLTTYYASGKIDFNQLFPYGNNDEFYRNYAVTIHPNSPVLTLDAERRLIVNQAGFELVYTQCLIASGASPFLPKIEGTDTDNILLMRSVEDAIKLKNALARKPRKALVLGASMIGIKLVELFHHAGIETCLVDLADRIFPLIAHPECAGLIQKHLTQSGIKLRFGMSLSRIEKYHDGMKAYFDGSDESEDADIIVVCIGVRSNIGFINQAQVRIDRGVIIDDRMRTGVPGLFAAGDVAQGKNLQTGTSQVIGLLANARYQGRVAGRNMAGIDTIFPGNIPHNITHFMGIDFVGIGSIIEYDRMDTKHLGRRFVQLFWKNNLIIGANLIDSHSEAGVIKSTIMKGLLHTAPGNQVAIPLLHHMLIKNILAEVEKL